MRGQRLLGLGVLAISVVVGCGSDDPAPGSKVGQQGGNGGMAGSGGDLALPSLGGMGGGGMAGGGMGGGGSTQGGKPTGGDASSAGKSAGGSGAGGSKPTGTCKRVNGSDADCAEFWEDDKTQAYACDDTSAASALQGTHAGKCASTSGIPGGNYGMCCPP